MEKPGWKGSPTLKPPESYGISGSGIIWVIPVGVCFPWAPLGADSQHVPAQGGEQRGRCDSLSLHNAPHCLFFSSSCFCECGFEGLCLWVLCVRRLQGFEGQCLGKSWTQPPHLHALDYTPSSCPLTLCWLQLCSGKNSHGSLQTVHMCKLED